MVLYVSFLCYLCFYVVFYWGLPLQLNFRKYPQYRNVGILANIVGLVTEIVAPATPAIWSAAA